MKHLKRFNESSEEKLYWEIPFNNVYYNNLPTIDFNRNYAKIIMDNLNNEWTGNLLNFSSEPPHWLDLNTNSGDKCVY